MNNTNEIEVLRKRAKNKDLLKNIIVLVSLVLIASCIIIYFFVKTKWAAFAGYGIFIFAPLLFIFLIYYGFVLSKHIILFEDRYIEELVIKALKTKFDNLKYDPSKNYHTINGALIEMVDAGDRGIVSYNILGNYKTTTFEYIYIKSSYGIGDDSEERFKGSCMLFKFEKNFKKNIQLVNKKFGYKRYSYQYEKKKQKELYLKNYNIFAEDDGFNNFLTPQVIDEINKIENILKKKIMISFVNQELHVDVMGGINSFKPKLYKKINDDNIQTIREYILSDIKPIIELVDIVISNNNFFED